MTEQESILVRLRKFFEMTPTEFVAEYKRLTDQDRVDLKKGVEDGTYNY